MVPRFVKKLLRPFRRFYLYRAVKSNKTDLPEHILEQTGASDVVLEAGANIGTGTLRLAKRVRFVYSFEPNPYAYEFLESVAKHNRNVKVFNTGLGDFTGGANLNLQREAGAGSSIVNYFERPIKRKVEIRPLDSFTFEYPPTVLIIDTEGFEVNVLNGARVLLSSGSLNSCLVETHYVEGIKQSTTEDVKEILGRYFPYVVVSRENNEEDWVIAKKGKV